MAHFQLRIRGALIEVSWGWLSKVISPKVLQQFLVFPVKAVHTILWICCNLQRTVVLRIIRKFSNYLQCNLAATVAATYD